MPSTSRPFVHRILWAAALTVSLAIAAAYAWTSRVRRANAAVEAPPVLGPVEDFSLTDTGGRTITRKDLLGKVWVVDFIFTSCAGTCPIMTNAMVEVQKQLADVPDFRSLSVSVDPARDTPQVLAGYADYYHADPKRWWFLTGEAEQIKKLIADSFKLMSKEDILFHSPRFSIVDRHGRVRGGCDGTEPESLPKLVRDVRAVAKEK